jgi:hypothetical protein
MSDYYSNPQSPYSSPYPGNNPYPGNQNQPYPQSSPFPQQSYPQSPPTGVPQQSQNLPAIQQPSFPSYYTGSQPAFTPQPEQRKSRARLVLIVAAVLMFAVAGVFAGLYVAAESDHDKANSVLEDKKAELVDVKADITAAEGDKSDAEQKNSDLESQNSGLEPCVDATQHYLWDVTGAPDAERQAALDAMFDACT